MTRILRFFVIWDTLFATLLRLHFPVKKYFVILEPLIHFITEFSDFSSIVVKVLISTFYVISSKKFILLSSLFSRTKFIPSNKVERALTVTKSITDFKSQRFKYFLQIKFLSIVSFLRISYQSLLLRLYLSFFFFSSEYILIQIFLFTDELATTLMNEYWPQLYRVTAPIILDFLDKFYSDLLKRLFAKLSFSEIFP